MNKTNKIRINVDVETRSLVDLRKTSAKVYARDPSTELIVVRYAREDKPHLMREWKVWEQTQCPADLETYMRFDDYQLVAHNAGFEHAIFTAPHLVKKHGFPKIALDKWDDTAARAARMALPRSLEMSAKALDLPVSKDMDGSRVMMQLCKPRSWDKENPPVWWTPEEYPDKYKTLSEYCATDVRVGMQLSESTTPLSEFERNVWLMTEGINEQGLYVDWRFAEKAMAVAKEYKELLDDEMSELTDGAVKTASKVVDLKNWLAGKGYAVMDEAEDDKIILDKGAVAVLLERDDLPADVRRALEIRRSAAKNSVAKYDAILNRVDKVDSRVRDTLVYHGASTGRWAGAGIQPQNFPRATMPDWEAVAGDIEALYEGKTSFAAFKKVHGDVMDVLSKMLRGTITAPDNCELVFPDYSAIEARGVAWVAGADSLIDLFASGGKVYEEFASKVYRKPVKDIAKDSTERFLAKTAILGAGYGMGSKKFQATCEAQGKEVTLEAAAEMIEAYRTENEAIPTLWRGLENAALSAVKNPGTIFNYQGTRRAPIISYLSDGHFLKALLPSGRVLYYRKPRVIQIASPWGPREAVEYSGVNSLTKQWTRQTTWGGRLTENVVQAVCRDLIARAMLLLKEAGYTLVGTVHDEVIVEVPGSGFGHKDRILEIMTDVPIWATGFPIAAEAGYGKRYGK